MAINVVHAEQGGDRFWGVVVPGGIAALPTRFPTTAALIAGGRAELLAAAARAPDLRASEVTLLSPITTPCRVICQGANYRQHMVESDSIRMRRHSTCSSRNPTPLWRRRWARWCGRRMCVCWTTKSNSVW